MPTHRAGRKRASASAWLMGVLVVTSWSCNGGGQSGGPSGGAPSATAAIEGPSVEDTYHGVKVRDPCRWLEDASDPRVREWGRAQAERTRVYLEGIPERAAIRRRMTELLAGGSSAYVTTKWAGGRLFALKNQPPLEQPLLVTLASADDPASEVVIVDPNRMDPSGTTAIDFFEPSYDGRLLAVSISSGGSEAGDVHLFEVATRTKLPDVVPRVNGGTAGGSVAWNPEGTGFHYTRYPRPGERPDADLAFYQQVAFHRVGDAASTDRVELGADFPKIAEIQLVSTRGGRVVAAVQNGDGGEFMHYLRRPDGRWVQLTRFDDRVVFALPAEDGAVYLVSRKDAPRGRVLRLAPGEVSLASALAVVEQDAESIQTDFASYGGLWLTTKSLFVLYQTGGPTTVRVFDLNGRPRGLLPSEPLTALSSVTPLDGDAVIYRRTSYVKPPAWFRWDGATGAARPTSLAETSPADFSDTEVVREWAVSKDGTRVPVNVLRRSGTKLDGSNPAILTGYGGYGISQVPNFRPAVRAWVEQGGIWAVANLRGGGEYGEAWHHAGRLTRKQNVFDDFAAAARALIDAGYTRPERLAIMGGSNGGLLMGATITQHPELVRAVVSFVGIYDMLRVELTANGAFNVTEFGTVKDAEQFRALYAYSPYHHVTDRTAYPAVLMITGENDPRVDPWHSRKMTARLQVATGSGRPILLRTDATSGHGAGKALRAVIEEATDYTAFLVHELGVGFRSSTE